MVFRVTPPETIGRYRVLGELGQGGTATVFLALASGPAGFNKLVVLKKMKPQFASESGFAEMFLTEARLAARLNHPNIVQTNEVFEHDALPVLVMEYLEGKSFADINAASSPGCPFSLWHSLTVISEALSGLHYSHELNDYEGKALELVHRDVTPHNIFVTYDGQVKILDFGIAKLKDSNVNTETGVVKGKLRYIPPEQIVGEAVDRRADIYAVGVMLWEIAAGEKLWRGLSDAAVMNRVINERIPRPSEKNPRVDPSFEAIIMRALSADPKERHQSALELQKDVDLLRESAGGSQQPRRLMVAMDAMFGADRAKTRKLVEGRVAEIVAADGSSPTSPTLKAYAARKAVEVEANAQSSFWLWPGALALMAATAAFVWWLADRQAASRELPALRPAQSGASEQAAGRQAAPASPTPAASPPRSDSAVAVEAPKSSVVNNAGPGLGAEPPAALPSRKTRPTSSSNTKSPAAVDCDPPFEFDVRGVKHFKRACLN
ncbi:MAG TPA: serine/threonine-protein kinase [Polyangiaceae bacterium]|jgi:serine/threonine-protein kinase|nr:serine/threonine-protein kinase [Polyangiaceae bacterium]